MAAPKALVPTYPAEVLIADKRFAHVRDIARVALSAGEEYTVDEAEKLINKIKNRKVV